MLYIRGIAALSLSFVLASTAVAAEFVPLVKGEDTQSLELVGIGPDTVKIADGEILVTGKPNGYFATKESYKNYVLKFDWMYERPADLASDAKFRGNSGLLIHIQEPHKVWPKCIEVQLQNASAGVILAINGAKSQITNDAAARKAAIKPVGQWNQEEVTCEGASVVCKINGVEVARAAGSSVESGPIGWQSEGAPIRFRNVMIKTLD